MRAFVRTTLALALVVVLLAGCVRPGTTTPAPTFQCTGADPDAPRTPCSQEEFEAQQKTYHLEREAMIVYEKFWAVRMALYEEGLPDDATWRLSPYLEDPVLSVTVTVIQRERELGPKSMQIKRSLRMWPSRAEPLEGSLVAIVGCEDTRGSTMTWERNAPTTGRLLQVTRHFKRVNGRLKHFNITSSREVERCDK